ncbi:MAG: hypothetical protein RLZZ127_659 [Planctomycetota bacterium]|jgi:hypothetical protein
MTPPPPPRKSVPPNPRPVTLAGQGRDPAGMDPKPLDSFIVGTIRAVCSILRAVTGAK